MKLSAIFTVLISLAAAKLQFQEIMDSLVEKRLDSILNECAVSGLTAQAILNAWETQDLEAVLEETQSTSNTAQVICLMNEVESARAIGCLQKIEKFYILAENLFRAII